MTERTTERKEAELRLAYKLLGLLAPPAMEANVMKELVETAERQEIPIETLLGLELTPNQEHRLKQFDELAVSRYAECSKSALITNVEELKTVAKKAHKLYPY